MIREHHFISFLIDNHMPNFFNLFKSLPFLPALNFTLKILTDRYMRVLQNTCKTSRIIELPCCEREKKRKSLKISDAQKGEIIQSRGWG